MNRRGFTLIEVVAIIVVIAGIFLVSFPYLSNSAKEEEEKKYTIMVENLCTAGKTYMYSNLNQFPELSTPNSEIEVKISELILYGNVNKNLTNPKTELSVENDTLKYVVMEDFTLDCKYIEE